VRGSVNDVVLVIVAQRLGLRDAVRRTPARRQEGTEVMDGPRFPNRRANIGVILVYANVRDPDYLTVIVDGVGQIIAECARETPQICGNAILPQGCSDLVRRIV